MENGNLKSEVKMEKSSSFAFKGILEVFYAPASLFKKVKEQPTTLVPYIVLFMISLLSFYLIKDLLMAMQIEAMREAGQPVTPQVESFMSISMIVFPTIALMLVPLITAGLALFFGNFIMGGKAKYKQLLSLMVFSELFFMIGNFITVPMALAKESLTADLSLGFLVAEQGIESVMWTALSKISLFHIWELVIVGIGLSIIFEFSRNKGYILSVLSVGLLSIIHIGAAALGAMFK